MHLRSLLYTWTHIDKAILHRLFRRALQTLLKPVPELIGILGVEIPEAPDVCLAGIRSDAATLTWTRPASHRPVHKYIIQVNSVNGEYQQDLLLHRPMVHIGHKYSKS